MNQQLEVKKAILLTLVCSTAYAIVYLNRDILSAMSPQLTQAGVFSLEQLGTLSSTFFITYAVGQLLNGIIGDKIKSKYMISFGLILASFCLIGLTLTAGTPVIPMLLYGAAGFFLAMVYAPMTKLFAENMLPQYVTRGSVFKNLSAYLGAPVAGVLAAVIIWRTGFFLSSGLLLIAGIVVFVSLTIMEKKGMIKYGQYQPPNTSGGGIRLLIRHRIIKWTFVAMLTGIVRTAVLFWLPSYISQYLNFPATQASLLYTVSTSVIAVNSIIALVIYEALKQKLDLSIFLFFAISALSFLLTYFVKHPYGNLCFMILAMVSSNCASTMLWTRYCPSLRDTGMVSTATGFLDFCSYGAASISSSVFAGAVGAIGWGNLILVWFGLMCCGVAVTAYNPKKRKEEVSL